MPNEIKGIQDKGGLRHRIRDEGSAEFHELPNEYPEEIPDEYLKEQDPEIIDLKEMDIPDVWWTESIKDIENPEIRQREIWKRDFRPAGPLFRPMGNPLPAGKG